MLQKLVARGVELECTDIGMKRQYRIRYVEDIFFHVSMCKGVKTTKKGREALDEESLLLELRAHPDGAPLYQCFRFAINDDVWILALICVV